MDAAGQDRAELLARLSEVLGPKHAATLMENLHPQPWSHLATKDDIGLFRSEMTEQLTRFEERIDLRFVAQTAQLEALVRERIDAQTKLVVFSLVGAVLTAAGVAIGSAAL